MVPLQGVLLLPNLMATWSAVAVPRAQLTGVHTPLCWAFTIAPPNISGLWDDSVWLHVSTNIVELNESRAWPLEKKTSSDNVMPAKFIGWEVHTGTVTDAIVPAETSTLNEPVLPPEVVWVSLEI
jgi:hypothetical protein